MRTKTTFILRTLCGLCALLFTSAPSAYAWTRSGLTFTTDGSFADTQAAIYAASNGCVVNLPPGTFTWGSTNQRMYVVSGITLQGCGTNLTVISLPTNSQDYYGSGAITLSANATVRNLCVTSAAPCGACPATGFSASGNGWRVSNILYYGNGGAYVMQATGYGLIDHCVFVGSYASYEMIFCYGPANSWQTPDSFGTTNMVVVENCEFDGQGYVSDANANSRICVRFCTITGRIKIDGHGKASDTPPRGVRQMEIYNNVWTYGGTNAFNAAAIEVRGGTAKIFGNQYIGGNIYAWNFLDEYGCLAQWPNFSNIYQTPVNYPIDDQVGVGMDPKVGGSDPTYYWMNTANGSGNFVNGLRTNIWALTWKQIPAGAIQTYTNETGNPQATFTTTNIIMEDRDFFSDVYITNFNGTTGMGYGTTAQMNAITPTKAGVGFWVTDQGNWNTTVPPNTSGLLYVWNGAAWTLNYTPLTYPYPGSVAAALAPPSNLHVAP